jgi:hypothetical protein
MNPRKIGEALPMKKGFLKDCMEALRDTNPPACCPYCGVIKKEFFNPVSSRISVVECECEREVRSYQEFYDNFRQCEFNRSASMQITYADFIDGIVQPKNRDEENIFKTGRNVKNYLFDMEEKRQEYFVRFKQLRSLRERE